MSLTFCLYRNKYVNKKFSRGNYKPLKLIIFSDKVKLKEVFTEFTRAVFRISPLYFLYLDVMSLFGT